MCVEEEDSTGWFFLMTDLMDLNALSPQLFFPGEADVHSMQPLAQILQATTSKTLGTPSIPTDTETTPAINLKTQYDLKREGTDRQDLEELDLIRQRIKNTYRQVWQGFYNWELPSSALILKELKAHSSIHNLPLDRYNSSASHEDEHSEFTFWHFKDESGPSSF